MTLLEASALRKRFGGLNAVAGVSVRVAEGEILGMIGANGSGKTTCLNLLTRLLAADGGAMALRGRSYAGQPAHALVGLGISRTFQNLRLFKDLTVRENVALGAQARHLRLSGRDALRRADALIERTGLGRLADVLPRALPYGTQRVVEIARALATGPALLMLDEPFAGMSSEEAVDISRILVTAQGEHSLAMLIVDHNVEVLAGLAHRFVALAEGRVICEGTPAAVLADPDVVASYVGGDA